MPVNAMSLRPNDVTFAYPKTKQKGFFFLSVYKYAKQQNRSEWPVNVTSAWSLKGKELRFFRILSQRTCLSQTHKIVMFTKRMKACWLQHHISLFEHFQQYFMWMNRSNALENMGSQSFIDCACDFYRWICERDFIWTDCFMPSHSHVCRPSELYRLLKLIYFLRIYLPAAHTCYFITVPSSSVSRSHVNFFSLWTIQNLWILTFFFFSTSKQADHKKIQNMH